jgi:hypothetical protein
MNNNGDINNSIFLNVGSKGFVKFGNRSDFTAGSGDEPIIIPESLDPVAAQRQAERNNYRFSIKDAIDKTYAQREAEKQKYIENYKRDVEKMNDDKKTDDRQRIPVINEMKREFIKPLTDARKNLYENTKKMKYELTLLEKKYHEFILKNIKDLPKKTEALRKAIIYIRNKKLAQKELSEKQKEFYKKQMDNYLKEWSKFNQNGNTKLQNLRYLYKINGIIKTTKDSVESIKKELNYLADEYLKNKDLLEKAKENNDEKEVSRLAEIVVGLKDTLLRLYKSDKEVARYIENINGLYSKIFPNVDNIPETEVAVAKAIEYNSITEKFMVQTIGSTIAAGIIGSRVIGNLASSISRLKNNN